MATMIEDRAAVREQLEMQIAAIRRNCPAPRAPVANEERKNIPENIPEPADEYAEPMREPFGRWLLSQRDRGDWIDDLAAAARADRGFGKDWSPMDVRKRLQALGADGDAFEQVDDAERCWEAL